MILSSSFKLTFTIPPEIQTEPAVGYSPVLPAKPAVHPETTTKIKPSEAIKLGRLLRPRVIPRFYDNGVDGACTLGAMALGFGLKPARRSSGGVQTYLAFHFPEMPQYVRDQITKIPHLMDMRSFPLSINIKDGTMTYKEGATPADIEATFIKGLEAMGY